MKGLLTKQTLFFDDTTHRPKATYTSCRRPQFCDLQATPLCTRSQRSHSKEHQVPWRFEPSPIFPKFSLPEALDIWSYDCHLAFGFKDPATSSQIIRWIINMFNHMMQRYRVIGIRREIG